MRTILGKMSFLLLCFSFCLFGCKQTGDNGNAIEEIRITIQADQGVKIGKQNTVNVPKNAKWASFKDKVSKLIKIESTTESVEWHINNAGGTLIKDETKFSEDKVIFGVSKLKTVSYKVEHLQQNITDNEYTKFEENSKTGVAGTDTEAEAKTYQGFTSKAFKQAKINADGSTVVKIYYDRNIISLTLDLAGGATTTPTENGEGGKVLLKGKFGANVEIATPTKDNHAFAGWNPELPKTFPATNPNQVYAAQWKKNDLIKVTILADERLDVSSPSFIEFPKSESKKWSDIKAEAQAKLTLKTNLDKEDYGFYDWKIEKYEGAKLDDNYAIIQDITVYARSNYLTFDIRENGTKIYYFRDENDYGDDTYKNPHRPIGRIIIPKGITIMGNQCLGWGPDITHVDFSEVNLKEMQKNCLQRNANLDNIDLSSCTDLTLLGGFQKCEKLKNIDFSKCKNINMIADSAFKNCVSLAGSIDLSSFSKLQVIGGEAFAGCSDLVVKLPTSIASIQDGAFGHPNVFCKQVIVPNEQIKKLVVNSGYPAEKIVIQQ